MGFTTGLYKEETLKVKIKKLNENVVIPTYAKNGDAGLDLTATSKEYDENGNIVYGTGLSFAIPKGYVGLLFPRSSNANKDLLLSNSVGVLDSSYRGEVTFKFKPSSLICKIGTDYSGQKETEFDSETMYVSHSDAEDHRDYEIGDRIGQLLIIPYPKVEFELVNDLSKTERGSGGYGSSGK